MINNELRIVFMGTSRYAEAALRSLYDQGYQIPLVVTQPDRRRGRNRKKMAPPVKHLAETLGLTVFQPDRIRRKESVKLLESVEPHLMITASYGQILKQKHLDIPEFGILNVHASLLPELRGAAPIQYSIMRGYKKTGVTIMKTDIGVDTGEILSKVEVEIDPRDTAGSLEPKLAEAGARLLVETIPGYIQGKITPVAQDHDKSTHAPMLSSEDGWIDWSLTSEEISNRIRGLNPCPGAYTTCRGQRLKVHFAVPTDQKCPCPGPPGTITNCLNGKGVLVKTGNGNLLIEELQPACKKRMRGDALIQGRYAEPGETLGLDPDQGPPVCQS